jgi:hypothetical protein
VPEKESQTIPSIQQLSGSALTKIYDIFRSERFQHTLDTLYDISGSTIDGLHKQIFDVLVEFREIFDLAESFAIGGDGVLLKISSDWFD